MLDLKCHNGMKLIKMKHGREWRGRGDEVGGMASVTVFGGCSSSCFFCLIESVVAGGISWCNFCEMRYHYPGFQFVVWNYVMRIKSIGFLSHNPVSRRLKELVSEHSSVCNVPNRKSRRPADLGFAATNQIEVSETLPRDTCTRILKLRPFANDSFSQSSWQKVFESEIYPRCRRVRKENLQMMQWSMTRWQEREPSEC